MIKLILMLALVIGVFAISQSSEAQPNSHWDRDYITCESHSYNYNVCRSYRVRHIERVSLVQQHSNAPCRYRQSWGADSRAVWVDNGCRATFEVSGWSK